MIWRYLVTRRPQLVGDRLSPSKYLVVCCFVCHLLWYKSLRVIHSSLGYSNISWLEVSYAWGQCLQWDPCKGFMRFRSRFIPAWPVLNWKMRLWSGRQSLLMGSVFFGLLRSANIARPVFPIAHSFSHFSLDWFLVIFLAVAMVHGLSSCCFRVPCPWLIRLQVHFRQFHCVMESIEVLSGCCRRWAGCGLHMLFF